MSKKTKNITFEELLSQTSKLSKEEFNKLTNAYIKNNGSIFNTKYEKFVLTDLEKHLKDLHVNESCPNCGSKIVKFDGKRENGIQRIKCCSCGKRYTFFTGTILEKTKFHWDLWIELIYQMIKETSIKDTQAGLVNDDLITSIDVSTIHNWRKKILNACLNIDMPILHGAIQVDETHYHESQKGVKEENMISVFPNRIRKARHHYMPAEYGVMGSEFATIITAIDRTGHCIGKVSGLGKFTSKRFAELFRDYIKDCSFLCSDQNNVYSKYCDDYYIPHYIRPSNYVDLTLSKTKKECEKLFDNNKLDYIEHRRLSFAQLEKIKNNNNLNLGLVNELHKDLRLFINKNKHGVSSKLLNGWVAWFCMLKNFAVDNGHRASSRKDAEKILEMLLKTKTNILIKDMKSQKLNLPKPTDAELKRLQKNTEKGRNLSGRKMFVFTEEDLIDTTAVRDMLYKMPLYLFKELCSHYVKINKNKYKGYSSYLKTGSRLKYVQKLEKEEDIKNQMLITIAKNGKDIYSSEEDPIHRKPNVYL